MRRLIIAGGGTGGHLYPGVAVAREAAAGGCEVLFVGTDKGIEARVLPREGFTLKTIRAGRYKGMGGTDRLKTLFGIPASIFAAARIIAGFRPQAVLGVGGYSSFPAVAAAWVMGVPTVIQEQNAVPGLANRWLGHVADAVALGFSEAARHFPAGRGVHTGNPIRKMAAGREAALGAYGLDEGRLTVLVFGGSGGAHRINAGVAEALPLLAGLRDRLQFIHQTGEGDLEKTKAAYEAAGFTARVLPFIYDMEDAYACADFVVCRSGALTLAELTALGKPALLVPYPFAADNHQEVNARTLERAGAARVLLDSEATGARLAKEITSLADNRPALAGMSEKARGLGRPDAAAKVFELIKGVALKG